jgi:hypothetical protein
MPGRRRRCFVDVESSHAAKRGQFVSGDVFLCQKIREEDRTLAVLSDGLGSGIKASVLATLTATMAMKYTAGFSDIKRSAETIMDTLPICSIRKISYSTFTIVDVEGSGNARIIEYDNPPYVLMRNGVAVRPPASTLALHKWNDRKLKYSEVEMEPGDRVVFFSDGVSQAGMGEFRTPLGWGFEAVGEFLSSTLSREPDISARQLASDLVARAQKIDGGEAKDDITCGVLHFREPRRMLVVTGPPFFSVRDQELAQIVDSFRGVKAVCGGTTANIVSRLLNRPVRIRLGDLDPEIPPAAVMDGIDLVTEGTLTLGRVAGMLECGADPVQLKPNAATELLSRLLDSDVIRFVVGTRINQAHQDPNVPVELDLRRNIVKKIAALLETKHVKDTEIQYL